ncbi:cytochrome P450 oxidoreductase [Histoplasma capsulatum var. duboisii H88]|uniref:Benzoate 4-monooxygenase cytochrome P450 n=1 Tax=Ajellomyces capsulatus (strain H88) TaxID=544711 RepID=F0UCX2_AJEC8|nr:cytochrome P450 oxidoreductase [Histoplasma capsulatum var. duboisii H88]QSS49578.1 benzoate 4-monooxygenase cytochrome P450 [Histoplasma capsulatum var. duboisii H88]
MASGISAFAPNFQFDNLQTYSIFVAFLFFISCIWTRYSPGLRNVPGPFVASFSNLWKIYRVLKKDMAWRNIEVHEKYGPLVRIGPNHVSASDPEALKTIYNFTNIFPKSEFYSIGEGLYEGKKLPTLFTTRSNEYHARLKRASAKGFSMTALSELEPYVNGCIELFLKRVEERSNDGKTALDIGPWMQFFAFDVLGEVNFSKSLGFLETGVDVDNNIAAIDQFLSYVSLIGQIPTAHYFLLGNPILPLIFSNYEKLNKIQEFAIAMVKERRQNPVDRKDILASLFEVHDSSPSKLSSREIVAITTTNILAGSDTTAITLRAVFYYLCKNPSTYRKLQREVDSAVEEGRLSKPATYKETTTLTYLGAVINEAMRIHPPTGFILERVVPEGGLTLGGTYLPKGTVVGVNSWVINYNKQVFGMDVGVFRPERWLEGDPEELADRNRNMFAFGAGPRVCIGKHISLLEMRKLVTEFVRHFNFELEDPKAELNIQAGWFVKQEGLKLKFKRRV